VRVGGRRKFGLRALGAWSIRAARRYILFFHARLEPMIPPSPSSTPELRNGFPPPSSAALAGVDRVLETQPRLKTRTPKYCLLVFGHQVTTRVWLILNGDILHVERDGALRSYTPEACTGTGGAWRECSIGDVVESPNLTHRELRLMLRTDTATLTMRSEGWGLRDVLYVVDNVAFAGSPSESPLVHLNGPLMIETALREGRAPAEITARIGTAGLGAGSFASITTSVAEQILARPVAEVAFQTTDGDWHREELLLAYDC
jgi:hypothetical protein